jgi:ribosome small subunit-dependent GTPase A
VRAKGDLSRKRTVIVDEDEAPFVDESLWKRGVVIAVHGLICRVDDEEGHAWECTVRRVLRTLLVEHRSPVAVGDHVWFSDQSEHHDGHPVGVIERVEDRRSVLNRRDRRGRAHTMVANADRLLIVTSIARPRLKPHLIDRYLVAAGGGRLEPIIVFNKWDLLVSHEGTEPRSDEGECRRPARNAGTAASPGRRERDDQASDASAPRDRSRDSASAGESASDPHATTLQPDELAVEFEDDDYAGPAMTVDDVVGEFADLGYVCLRTSAETGQGLDELRALLRGHMTVLAGQSGVGKSSLLNALQPGLNLKVREVSEETEKGRHTTTLARMLRLDFGGYVVDTPGIRAFDLWNVEPGELEAYFIEFVPRVPECRFKDCHHTENEPGCAVQAAVDAGKISPRRYYSYLKMLEELAAER